MNDPAWSAMTRPEKLEHATGGISLSAEHLTVLANYLDDLGEHEAAKRIRETAFFMLMTKLALEAKAEEAALTPFTVDSALPMVRH